MKLHTILIVAHLVALTVGLGSALIADMTVARRALFRAITPDTVDMMHFLGRLVTVGLVAVWITGLALMAEMVFSGSTLLTNPKFWAKVVIVEILTLNALAVHGIVMPVLEMQVGRRLLDGLSVPERVLLGAIGAISVTSWAFPMVLGTARELNHMVPMLGILALYGAALVASMVVAATLTTLIPESPRSSQDAHDAGWNGEARYGHGDVPVSDTIGSALEREQEALLADLAAIRLIAALPPHGTLVHDEAARNDPQTAEHARRIAARQMTVADVVGDGGNAEERLRRLFSLSAPPPRQAPLPNTPVLTPRPPAAPEAPLH